MYVHPLIIKNDDFCIATARIHTCCSTFLVFEAAFLVSFVLLVWGAFLFVIDFLLLRGSLSTTAGGSAGEVNLDPSLEYVGPEIHINRFRQFNTYLVLSMADILSTIGTVYKCAQVNARLEYDSQFWIVRIWFLII